MGKICLANIITGLARLENTKILDNNAQKYQNFAIYHPNIPILSDTAINLDPFNILIMVRVFKKLACHLTVTVTRWILSPRSPRSLSSIPDVQCTVLTWHVWDTVQTRHVQCTVYTWHAQCTEYNWLVLCTVYIWHLRCILYTWHVWCRVYTWHVWLTVYTVNTIQLTCTVQKIHFTYIWCILYTWHVWCKVYTWHVYGVEYTLDM